MQLERILQQQGFGTRKACRSLVRHERVLVNGALIDDPFADIPTEALVLTVDGETWPYAEFATILLHKPAGYECSRKPKCYPSVLQLLPPPLRERDVQPIGRLDADTTGLLLLTDDGQLNHRLTSPRHKVPKVYQASTAEPVTEAQIAALLAGVQLHDEPTPIAAAGCRALGECQLELTLTEGKYHQVKRMVAAAGNAVSTLHRSAIGGLTLPAGLPAGEWCWLTAADLARLEETA